MSVNKIDRLLFVSTQRVQVKMYKFTSFLSLEIRPAIKYLLLKKWKCHTNDIFTDRENYGEFQTVFHFLTNLSTMGTEWRFFSFAKMTRSTFYFVLECIREKIQKLSIFRRCKYVFELIVSTKSTDKKKKKYETEFHPTDIRRRCNRSLRSEALRPLV
jgi:hypothetical protein